MRIRLIIFTLACFTSAHTFAQNVDDVFSKFFSETGGLSARKNLTSLKITGTAPSPRGDFPITLYSKKPNRLKVVLDIQGKQYIAQAYDGSVAWGLNPFQGGGRVEKLPEEMSTDIVKDANFDETYGYAKLLNYKEKGYKATLEGKEKVEGRDCFKIKMVKNKGTKDDPTEYYYFDTGTNFLSRYTITGVTDNKKWEKNQYFSDYREVSGGLKMPFYQEVRFNDKVIRKLIAKNITVNESIDETVFAYKE